jgi:hypothetical protein
MRAGVLVLSVSLSLIAVGPRPGDAAVAASVRLERVVVSGHLGLAPARKGLGQRLAAVSGCATAHLKAGRSKRVNVILSVKGGKVTAVRLVGAADALKRCISKALMGRAILASGDGRVTARLQLDRRSPAARRRARLQAALSGKLGLLKLLGTKGRGGATGNLFGSGSISGGRLGGVSGLYGTSRPDPERRRRERERRERERKEREQQRARLLARALRVPKVRARPAAWVRPELSGSSTGWFPTARRAIATSPEAAIVAVTLAYRPERAETSRRRTIYLAVHRTRGVLGEVTPPASPALWSIDTHGVHLVTREGRLHHAPSLDAATRAGAWTAGARIDRADWDLVPGLIVAAEERVVHVSVDGGRTFSKTTPPTSSKLEQVAARYDGVIVVRAAEDGTFISPDRGRSWERSSFQPRHFWRKGAWIYARNACEKAILAADKRTWVQGELPSVLERYRAQDGKSRRWGRGLVGWEALVDASEEPLSFAPARHPTSSDPPPPALSKRSVKVTGAPQPCKGGAGIGGIGRGGGAPTGCGYGAQGKGFLAQCVRGTIGREPRGSTLWVGWLADGMTGGRPPSLVVLDHREGKLSFGALPAGCQRPRQVRSLRGIALLVCEAAADERKSQIFAADARGAWHEEALLDAPAEQLSWFIDAPDGTLLVQSCHYDREREKKEGSGHLCGRAFVRRPVALGAAGAWRQLRATDALTYRPLSGGRALVVDRAGAGNNAIQLLIEGPRRTRVLARSIQLDQDLQNLEVEQGRILVRLGGNRAEHVLSRELRLEALPRRY